MAKKTLSTSSSDDSKKESIGDKINKWITQYEKKHSTNLIVLVDEVCDNMFHRFVRFLRKIDREKKRRKKKHITIVLHTEIGGDSEVAARMVQIIMNLSHTVKIIVPEKAASAGSEIALCADKLILGKYAFLTAFDDQYGGMPSKNIMDFDLSRCKTVKDYNRVKESHYTHKLTRKEINIILGNRYKSKVVEAANELFHSHSRTHEYPISAQDILSTGIKHVKSKKVPRKLHKILHQLIIIYDTSKEVYPQFFY